MSNDLGSLNTSQSESERTNKPLVVSCNYNNTKHQKLTFYTARECSCDELRAKVKESFKLTARPFKMWWDDDDGEQNFIEDEATLDEAIQYYQSADEISVTIFVKISPEYGGRGHSGVSRLPMVGREVDFAEGFQNTSAHSESSPLMDTVQDAGNSTQNTFTSNPPAHTHSPDTYAASSIDGDATERGIGDGSTDAGSSYGISHSQHYVRAWLGVTRNQAPGRDPMLDALDGQSLSSLSLSGTDPSVLDGGPDASILPHNRARRVNHSSSRSSRPLAYEALSHGSQSNYEIGISDDSPHEFTSCSECECILDSIKYTCTTCSGKTPMTRPTLLAAEAKGKDRDRAASTGASPTRTVVGRGHNSSVSSSSTARAGYELCGACFGTVAVNHSWVFCVPGSFSIPKEKARLSQPKQTGLLRHAFVEKVWNLHWKDVEQENMRRICSGCKTGLSGDRYKCGSCVDYTLCRGCFGIVHEVHPAHPFLDMNVKPAASEALEHFEMDESRHSQNCDSCDETIIGVRYQCLNCPSKPSSYNLCSECEVNSYIVHDPMHTFLKIPRPVDIPDPLESELPFIPPLYRHPAGPAPGSRSVNGLNDLDPTAYLRNLTHDFALCDQHMIKIVGKWYHCAYCPKDLCAGCEAIDSHDKTHAFLVFKAPVDKYAFRPFEDAGNEGKPPLLHGNIYNPQNE